MENLSLEEINELIVQAGGSVVAETVEFRQINASGEASYRITYDAPSVVIVHNEGGEPEEVNSDKTINTIFITTKEDGSFKANINTLT